MAHHKMISAALLDELVAQANAAPVIDIGELAERRAPIQIEIETDCSFKFKGGGVEINYGGQVIFMADAVLDYVELFRKSQGRRG
ncbi:MAG: hypothetical protein D3M94_07285 [Rhodocyclales bacterium GT-UBC]|nr:MAG: hypothetical protein D3M94_07285 [Rhodocyclales bacterium GT-UBC]